MRLLIEMKIDDELAQNVGYSLEEISELSEKFLKSYWFDEGIIFKNGDDEDAADAKTVMNIYMQN